MNYKNLFKLKTLLILTLILGLSLAACKKDDPEPEPTPPPTPDPPPTLFIKGTVNGEFLNAEKTISGLYFPNATFPISSFQQQIAGTNLQGWTVSLSNVDLDAIKYPKTLRQQTTVECTYNNGGAGSGNFSVNPTDSTLFNFILTSWSEDILQGTFAGTLGWEDNVDSTLTFTDCSFQVKLIRK